jgi:twitching motility protein PilT
MIDNQQAAQLLFNHQLASQDQILACWPEIRGDKDIGMVLVEKGLLAPQTYHELAAYLGSLASVPESQPGAQNVPAASPRQELDLDYRAPLDAAGLVPPEPEGDIVGFDDENWSAAPLDEADPAARKTTRAEHNLRKSAASASVPAVESFIESVPSPAELAKRLEATGPVVPLVEPTAMTAPFPASAPAAVAPAAAPAGSAATAASVKPARRPSAPVQAPETVGPDTGWVELLAFARRCDAADLHLSAGNPILLRRYGSLQAATQTAMEQTSLRAWVEAALTAEQMAAFDAKGDLELIYTLEGWGRYRVTILKQRRGWDVTARVIPDRIRGFDESGMPESCRELTKWAQGLVLVTGPVGCGKSSTLATLVEMVNQERHDHIISIEDPIEIVYQPAHCRITQRQIGPHTLTRDAALRASLREDPDIIVISELRDLDTIRLAVSAAETGHLVFGTMNTTNAARTLYRLIDSFPPEEQGIIRNMISESLRGVISQQLVPRKDGQGMLPAFEVLLINSAVANMIRKDEAHQLHTAMLTGKSSGMVLLDDSLRALLDRGLVDVADVIPRATVPKDFMGGSGHSGNNAGRR